jgi:hypothetical protein
VKIQEINKHIAEQILTASEDAIPTVYDMAPYRPCPVCPGVLREEEAAYMRCWTCGTVVGLPVDKRTGRR